MSLTQQQYDALFATALASLDSAKASVQTVIDAIDASFAPSGPAWSRVGVVNNPTFSNGDRTVAATGVHLLRSTVTSPALSRRYWEILINVRGASGYLAGGAIRDDQDIGSPPNSLANVPPGVFLRRSDGWTAHAGASQQNASPFDTTDVLRFFTNEFGELYTGLNANWAGDLAARTGALFTGLSGNIGACLCFMGANGGPVATGLLDPVDWHFAPPFADVLPLGA